MSIEERKIALAERFNAEIVAYTVDGKPLDRKSYRMELQKAESDFENGRTYGTHELIKAIKN